MRSSSQRSTSSLQSCLKRALWFASIGIGNTGGLSVWPEVALNTSLSLSSFREGSCVAPRDFPLSAANPDPTGRSWPVTDCLWSFRLALADAGRPFLCAFFLSADFMGFDKLHNTNLIHEKADLIG